VNAAIDAVLAGRNVLKGATDQGMTSDPNGRWPGGRVYGQDQVYNDWGGGPGGHAGAAHFREEQQRQVLAGAAKTHGASLRDHIRGGRSPQSDGELLKRGMKAVDAGGGIGTNHKLSIDFTGMPRGTKTAFKEGGLFKEVTLNRGRPMAPASETS
jgi:hypothetical protein